MLRTMRNKRELSCAFITQEPVSQQINEIPSSNNLKDTQTLMQWVIKHGNTESPSVLAAQKRFRKPLHLQRKGMADTT